MRKILILTLFGLFVWTSYAKAVAFTDPAVLAAILQQTATQTAEHLRELAQAIQQVQLLQSQLSNAQNLLSLAQQSAQGIDGLQSLGDFRNVILSANSVIQSIQSDINTSNDLSQQWKNLFGSLDPWIQNSNSAFANINTSDKMNSSSYLVGDSYQHLYEQNANTISQFMANAQQVSEKGALKQIAVETAQLIQMENNVIYLLSQLLKGQSIEASNTNLKRKEEAVQFQQENQGVRAFMGIVDDKTYEI
ncbi:MAG: hypothetical protein HQL15_06245 [Candidatus Omnitrophica bacterium]|nr:hypothetical protein [Candidatus Omnitrophota bacterium]